MLTLKNYILLYFKKSHIFLHIIKKNIYQFFLNISGLVNLVIFLKIFFFKYQLKWRDKKKLKNDKVKF